MTESDGIAEVFEETVRVTASAVGTGRMLAARGQEQRFTQARAASEQQARVLQARLATERAAALSELAVVDQPAWWEQAPAGDVKHAWDTACSWRDREPAANRAAVLLRAEHLKRTGVDLDARPQRDAAPAGGVELGRLIEASFPQPAVAAVGSAPPRPPRARTARRVYSAGLVRERQR